MKSTRLILFVKSDTLGARIVHKFQNFISLLLLLLSLYLSFTRTHTCSPALAHIPLPNTKIYLLLYTNTQTEKSNNSLPISGYHILIYSHSFLDTSLTLMHCLSLFTHTHTLAISQTQSFTHTHSSFSWRNNLRVICVNQRFVFRVLRRPFCFDSFVPKKKQFRSS